MAHEMMYDPLAQMDSLLIVLHNFDCMLQVLPDFYEVVVNLVLVTILYDHFIIQFCSTILIACDRCRLLFMKW